MGKSKNNYRMKQKEEKWSNLMIYWGQSSCLFISILLAIESSKAMSESMGKVGILWICVSLLLLMFYHWLNDPKKKWQNRKRKRKK